MTNTGCEESIVQAIVINYQGSLHSRILTVSIEQKHQAVG